MNKNLFVLPFQEADKTKLRLVGGKGANLGKLIGINGIHVPDGFCVTTETFKRIIESTAEISELLDQLSLLKAEDGNEIKTLSDKIRITIEKIIILEDIKEAICEYISRLGEADAYAVRSSATAEDLPNTSFAGQQDTYLNIIGTEAILKHVSKCWASLFTERAIIYRIQNGFDHRKVQLAVIIQRMVFPEAAGVLFTADPVTGDRKMLSIDASYGLGEALVSGLLNPDVYKVYKGKITDKKIATKKLAIYGQKNGGTRKQEIETGQQNKQVLTDRQILELEHIGRKIEAHFCEPQDIEWCLANDTFYIVQSRPITTLFPIPERQDEENHVYLSVGHQQMMIDPLRPLGLSLFQLTAAGKMYNAGGRLFVDVTQQLSSPASRATLLKNMGEHDPLMKSAIMTIIEREDFIKVIENEQTEQTHESNKLAKPSVEIENNPEIVTELIKASEESIAVLKQKIQLKSGVALFDFILEDIAELKKIAFSPKGFSVFMAAINASTWINEKMNEWLGEKNVADILSQSVPNNNTSEMGLALLDVADAIRPYPQIVEYLQNKQDNDFLNGLIKFEGGQKAKDTICAYLEKYGMRGAGEIDITNPRWGENPSLLIPVILSNVKHFEANASKHKFEQGRQEALKKEQELLNKLKQLPDGEQKAEEIKKKISLLRNFIGYREYPKYSIISRYFVYKQAILKEAEQLLQAKIIHEKEDIYYLPFDELREVVQTGKVDYQLIDARKEEYKRFRKLTPPRVLTSDGETLTGAYNKENLPPGAHVGLAVSSGIIEGRARIILNMKDANLEDGDILVTVFTDPSWTPLFLSIKGLVTEVGGLMTHGAVIAREYGLPAVVGVEHATKLIKDGQRIRVNGTDGYIELL